MTKKKFKICWITPGHLCNSPRLRKEVKALYTIGYDTAVIATQYFPYLNQEDDEFIKDYPDCKIKVLRWSKSTWKEILIKYTSGTKIKLFTLMYRFFPYQRNLVKTILNRHYQWQLTKAVEQKADLYIAHNVGALAVAAEAAKINNTKFSFDAEDFHLGEAHSPLLLEIIKDIEQLYLPKANFLTAASPLIAKSYQEKYALNKITPILNVFPYQKLKNPKENNVLKLFWFSQYVGKGRGLEECFAAIAKLGTRNIELHLLGFLPEEEKAYFKELQIQYLIPENCIYFHPVIPEKELINFTAQFDVGLALEHAIPYNRDICLTNKLFVYIQAGLAMITSKTQAQDLFLHSYPEAALGINLNQVNELATAIDLLAKDKTKLLMYKQANKKLGGLLNWETEQQKFVSIVEECLKEKKSSL